MQSNYLITGGTGFVGSNLVRRLIGSGDVNIITRNKKLNWRLSDIKQKIKIHELDLVKGDVKSLIGEIKPDYIFHLAAYGVLPNQRDPKQAEDVIVKGTKNLISSLKKAPFKLLINTGTFFEYGGSDKKLSEEHRLRPINHYAKAKAQAALLASEEAIKNNLPIITFRLFSPFGYYEDKTRLIPSVILSALKNEKIKVSIPSSVRDFVFIEDVVGAYLKAKNIDFKPGETINIGSGKQHSIEEAVSLIVKLTGSKSQVEWGKVPQRISEPKSWEADITKARKLLMWKPEYGFEKALRKTIEWFKQNAYLYE